MKFVYNQKKTDEISDILMMKPTLAEAQALLEKDETDGYALFKLGMALGLEKRAEEALEAFSKGIMYHPFYAPNYFGRGRRHNSMGHYYAALADFTMCIQLDPSVWTYRYYRATCESVHGDIESALSDFEECIPLTIPSQRYVIVHWLYTTYAELGLYDKAEESLEYVDGIVECPRRNYGYRRSVQLYKGIVKPEKYINEEEMAYLTKYIERGYALFRSRVAEGRGMRTADVERIAQGRVWLGQDALKVKLVDELGGLDKAVAKAAKLASLAEYHTQPYPGKSDWLDRLLNSNYVNGYIDSQARQALGPCYEPVMLLRNIEGQAAIQARIPFIPNIR